ncbi:MAG: ANTAR domain-containing protein, partial [Nocardioidaceae bacterium]
LQVVVSEGPGGDASRLGRAQLVPDLCDLPDDTWPWFAPAALELGARAVFVFPLQVGPVRLGTLTLHRTTPGGLSPDQIRETRALAGAAALLLTLHDRGDGPGAVPWAVGDGSRFRAEVHQAVGVTMVLCDVDAADAFAVLCAHAYATGRPMGEIAGEVVSRRLRLGPD